jgi:hypothetical protein
MFSVSSGPFFGPTNIDMEEYAMSLDQITVRDGFLVFWTVLGWLVIIIFMVTMRRVTARFLSMPTEASVGGFSVAHSATE